MICTTDLYRTLYVSWIDDIAFELFAMHCGIRRGVRQKKIPQEKWLCRKYNKPIVSLESPHQPKCIWFFLNAISSIRIPWCGLVSKINDMWIRSQGFKPLSFVCIYISHLVTRNVILIYLWFQPTCVCALSLMLIIYIYIYIFIFISKSVYFLGVMVSPQTWSKIK